MKKRRLPRLSRGWRIVRNLALTALTAVFVWGLYDFPLPPRMDFRRQERENLVGRSHIQGVFQGRYGDWMGVGVQEDQVVVKWMFGLTFQPREGGTPMLIPIASFGLSPEEIQIVAVDVPEGTASAGLELSIDGWYTPLPEGGTSCSALEGGPSWEGDTLSWTYWAQDYHGDGTRLKDGGVLFQIPVTDEGEAGVLPYSKKQILFETLTKASTYQRPAESRMANCHMEAVFYGEDGAELGRAALSTPEGGMDDAS